MHALVIGGTGPTGPFMVNGLRERGYEVAILHTGSHERSEIPDDVEHIHTDPYREEAVREAVLGREFELCLATYGRLRAIARVMAGRVDRFVAIGGVPAYRGFMNPALCSPPGLPVPTREDAPRVVLEEEDGKGWRIARTEDAVFEHHPRATLFRYPFVYGPYQLVPREWCVVRRILDGRETIVLPDAGLCLHSFGYVENLAHAVLLAIDQPDAAAGQIYNCADDEILSLRQVVEIVSAALGASLEIVSMPYALATPARPLVMQPLDTHRVLDTAKIRAQLGYRDVVAPREGLARTARWLVENPPEPGGVEETVLQDPFDYAAEDRLIAAWRTALASVPEVEWKLLPGYGLAYSGPGGRARRGNFE